MKGIGYPCVNKKITQARVIRDNVDILDWYVHRTIRTQMQWYIPAAIKQLRFAIDIWQKIWHFSVRCLELWNRRPFYRFQTRPFHFLLTWVAFQSFSMRQAKITCTMWLDCDISGMSISCSFTLLTRMRHMLWLSKSTTLMELRYFFRLKYTVHQPNEPIRRKSLCIFNLHKLSTIRNNIDGFISTYAHN